MTFGPPYPYPPPGPWPSVRDDDDRHALAIEEVDNGWLLTFRPLVLKGDDEELPPGECWPEETEIRRVYQWGQKPEMLDWVNEVLETRRTKAAAKDGGGAS